MVFVHSWKSLYSEAFIVITLIYELLFAPVRGEIRSWCGTAHVFLFPVCLLHRSYCT